MLLCFVWLQGVAGMSFSGPVRIGVRGLVGTSGCAGATRCSNRCNPASKADHILSVPVGFLIFTGERLPGTRARQFL